VFVREVSGIPGPDKFSGIDTGPEPARRCLGTVKSVALRGTGDDSGLGATGSDRSSG
jgi:hypothetical protein